jgi:CRISPR-associated Csx2 family protein
MRWNVARVLISGIGTGQLNGQDDYGLEHRRKYRTATYLIDQKKYETEFIASALIEHYQIEKVFLVGTVKSMWENVYEYFAGANLDEEYYFHLVEAIEKSNYLDQCFDMDYLGNVNEAMNCFLKSSDSRCFLIKYGLNEEEIIYNFGIFQDIAELLESGDEVFLDITHSFRSLALFQYTMVNYIDNLSHKNIEVKGVFYGMLETAREMQGITPVVNLKTVYELSNWVKAIHELKSYGNGYIVSDLLRDYDKRLANKIKMFSDLVNLNYLAGVKNQVDNLSRLNFEHINGPGSMVAEYLNRYVNRFASIRNEWEFQFEMAKWYFENKRYATGYIALIESILTRICELLALDPKIKNNRDEAKNILYNNRSGANLREVRYKFDAINRIRKNVAHVLDDRDERNYLTDVRQSAYYIRSLEGLLKRLSADDLR